MANANGAKPRWQELYESAALETGTEKLTALGAALETALMDRGRELGGQPGHDGELQEMKAAAQKLLLIKTEILGWPDINLDGQWLAHVAH